MDDFIRKTNFSCVKELIKQLAVDGVDTPKITLKLSGLFEEQMFEPLIHRFREKPEIFLEVFKEVLRKIAEFEDPRIKKYLMKLDTYREIHVVPDCHQDAEWLVPVRENFTKDMTNDQNKIFRFKARFMSLGLERIIEFKEMKWECLVCGAEFDIISFRKTREKYLTPKFCNNKRCKAKGKYDFRLLEDKSVKYEKRTFTLIDLENKEIINEIKCYISQNIDYFSKKAKSIRCNDEIEVLGILKIDTADLFTKKEEQQIMYYIEVLDINTGKSNEVDPTIIKEIKKEMKKNDLYCNRIIDSIHPYSQNIINFFPIKSTYGLSFITSDSYTNIRNGINSIIAGHSGTLKSKIGNDFKRKLGPNNFGIIYGKNTTAKGLVPVAQRNNQEKNLVKRYGAIPFYNKKTFMIDEAQYLYKKDPDALECFKCFEEGVISRALDGTTINAPAEGTVIFSLNYQTEDESFDFSKSLVENLGFPGDQKSILDRFDLHYRIPRNTDKLVEILVNRGDEDYKPKFLVSDELIFNYFIEAKRIYTEGVSIPKKITKIIKAVYNSIIAEKKASKEKYILNPREAEILRKVLKGIAAMRLRSKVNESDIEYLKKFLINTIIPFQDNKYVISIRTLDVNEIFFNAFELLTELHKDYFKISEFIGFLREYLESNYFEKDFAGSNLPVLGSFIDEEKNLTNNKFRKLLEENKDKLEDAGYFVDKINNKTSIINRKWVYSEIKENIFEIFKENKSKPLEIKSVVEVLELNLSFTKELIIKQIKAMIKKGLFKKIDKNTFKME